MQRISLSPLFFHVCRLRYALFLLLFLAMSAQLSAARPLFSRGRSVYSIVLSPDASVSEQTAARELQQYLQEMSGATLPISHNLTTAGPCVYVGYNAKVEALTHAPQHRSASLHLWRTGAWHDVWCLRLSGATTRHPLVHAHFHQGAAAAHILLVDPQP